ncbi:hypothetical protein FSP39_006634 [Pinctada imbricata]|uniref:B box-type domain-containing protein n=1 Tax=Pinctada imbricata TaxID=66713 RepID=A0AA88YQ02_PINIB|nr:hypothetical protein FSP39_006634 [Pinctada imbricata]
MAMSKSVKMEHAQAPVPCNLCDNEEPGEHYCVDCKYTLCVQCEKTHRKIAKDHKVVLRSQVGDPDSKIMSCTEHGERAIFHCEICSIPVCAKCVIGDHQGHKMGQLTDLLEERKKSLQNNINEIRQDTLPKLENMRKNIDSEREYYELKVNEVAKEMEAENKYIHEEVERIHNERIKRLNNIRETGLMVFDRCANEITMTKDIALDIESQYQDAIERNVLQSLPKKPLPEVAIKPIKPELPKPPSFVPGSKQELVKIMGKLQVSLMQIPPQMISVIQSPLEGSPSVCITKEGEVWIGGFESKEIAMVNMHGQVNKKRKTPFRNRSLAVLDNGDIVLSPIHRDSSVVSILQRDGNVEQLFDLAPTRSTGVSVTPDQKVLICNWKGKVLRINSGGSGVLKCLYTGSGDDTASDAIAAADGKIVVSDRKTPAVVLISYDGKILSKLTHAAGGKKLGCPAGLALDDMGNILCGDKDNNCVYIIGQDHQMRELVGPSHGIQEPRDLATDNENNLWITQYNGLIRIFKYLA